MAGSSSRIYNFCNRNPESCNYLGKNKNTTPLKKTEVEEYLISNNNSSGAPFSVCNYGNAFTGVEKFAGEGNARIGPDTPVNKDMYFRYASMTKSMGITCLAAALEDGYISSIDDPISKYIEEFNRTGSYMSGYTVSDPIQYDSYGTPIYTMKPPISYDYNNITIRHLVTATAGFGYSFLGTSTFRSGLNLLPDPDIPTPYTGSICNRNTFIAWIQNLETVEPSYLVADTIDSFYQSYSSSTYEQTFTKLIINRITNSNIPLLFQPGTQTLYDISTTIMGAVVGAALQKKGKNITSTQYLKDRILIPLGIKSIWFNCGSSNPPSNAETNITDAYFVRNDTYVNSNRTLFYPLENGKGPDVIRNTLYRCSDTATIGDGFTNQATKAYFQKSNGITNDPDTNDYLAGGYDWSGCGTLPDLCKLLKFFILKGKNSQGKQILKTQTIEWILTPKMDVGQSMWLFGNDTSNYMDDGSSWCGGFAKFMINPPFPCSKNTYYWPCYYGMHFYFDTDTGNYMVSGTQFPAGSWYKQDNYSTTPLYGIVPTTISYEPNSITLWNLINK